MRPTLVLLVALAFAGNALAQEGSKPSAGNTSARLAKDKEKETFNEIERGFYVGVGGGGWLLFNPPVIAGGRSAQYFSPGLSIEVEVGVDLGQRVSIAAFFLAAFSRMGADYTGWSNGAASGDFSSFMPGLTGRVNIIGINDSQDVTRWWIFVRAGAAFTIYAPKALMPNPNFGGNNFDILVFGGPGIEYYTRLRHFSIGLEVDFVAQVMSATLGINVMPTLRYAF